MPLPKLKPCQPPPSIAIFGGSFDPIHLGHLHLAKKLLDSFTIETLYVVPTGANPLKPSGPQTSGEHRLQMVKLAIQNFSERSRIEILDWEMEKHPSFTIDTLERASAKLSKNVTLVIGNDVFSTLPNWKQPKRILQIANILVVTRSPSPPPLQPILKQCGMTHLLEDGTKVTHSNNSRWVQAFALDALPFSSTEIRNNIAKHWKKQNTTSCPTGLAPEVWNYIKKYELYSVPPMGGMKHGRRACQNQSNI